MKNSQAYFVRREGSDGQPIQREGGLTTDVDTLAPEERQEVLHWMAPHNLKKAFPVTFINGKVIIGYQKDLLIQELGIAVCSQSMERRHYS